jgi:hypothetical protein
MTHLIWLLLHELGITFWPVLVFMMMKTAENIWRGGSDKNFVDFFIV